MGFGKSCRWGVYADGGLRTFVCTAVCSPLPVRCTVRDNEYLYGWLLYYNDTRVNNRICVRVRGGTHESEMRHAQHNCRWAFYNMIWLYFVAIYYLLGLYFKNR